MVRFARWLPFAFVLSCGMATERPVQLGMSIYVPQITLDRLDPQLHLRVFPKGDYTCDTSTGQVLRGGVHVADYAGGNVRPDVRCDATMWAAIRNTAGEAAPIDTCFANMTGTSADVPAGNYIVLVEGSGHSTGTGAQITLGSGCQEIAPIAGQTLPVSILMVEQSDAQGVCGDSMIAGNEECDSGSQTPACDHCHFPEVPVNTSMTTNPRSPSIAWAPSQRMVVGFEANGSDDPFIHQLDQAGQPITNPAVLANDNVLDSVVRNEQHNVRVFATGSGYAATWESTDRTGSSFDVRGTFTNYDSPPPPPTSVIVNPTTPAGDRQHPAVAVNGTTIAFAYEDSASMTLRVATTSAAMPVTAPSTDTALVAAGGTGATGATNPHIAATASGFVVTWAAGTMTDMDVYAVRLDATGAPQGMPLRVNTTTANNQDQPAIAAAGNDVVIAWRDASGTDVIDNSGSTVRWRHLDAMLAPDGNDRIAPTTVTGDQSAPTTAIAMNGVILIAWEDASGSIRGREFRANGSPVLNRMTGTDADFEVSAGAGNTVMGTGPRHLPSAAFGGNGLFGVVWVDQGLSQIRSRTIRSD